MPPDQEGGVSGQDQYNWSIDDFVERVVHFGNIWERSPDPVERRVDSGAVGSIDHSESLKSPSSLGHISRHHVEEPESVKGSLDQEQRQKNRTSAGGSERSGKASKPFWRLPTAMNPPKSDSNNYEPYTSFRVETGKNRYDPSSIQAALGDHQGAAFDPDNRSHSNRNLRQSCTACIYCILAVLAFASAMGIAIAAMNRKSPSSSSNGYHSSDHGEGLDMSNGASNGAGISDTGIRGDPDSTSSTKNGGDVNDTDAPFKMVDPRELNRLCRKGNVGTHEGYGVCKGLCEAAICCFSKKWEPVYSCLDSHRELCDPYIEACSVLNADDTQTLGNSLGQVTNIPELNENSNVSSPEAGPATQDPEDES